jgi:heme/copper-type cytochrome/quinol oxidase subunit 4
LLAYADFFIVFQILTAFFVGAILWFSLRAYRLTNMSFLIAFFLGFLLLESSFTFVLINRLVGHTGILYHGTFWIQEILQTAAFTFMASAYYFKNKELTNARIATYVIAMIIIIVLSVIAFLLTPPTLLGGLLLAHISIWSTLHCYHMRYIALPQQLQCLLHINAQSDPGHYLFLQDLLYLR